MPVGQAIAQAVPRGGGGAPEAAWAFSPPTLVPDGLLVRAQSGVLAGPAPGLWRACGQPDVSGSPDSTH